jgi:glutamate/tyrosine decarboxylase-like PLP-dependent enzyme
VSHETADDLGLLAPIDEIMHPYRERFPAASRIPAQGRARSDVLALMEQLRSAEIERWRDGYASGSVYHGDESHIDFLNKIYAAQSQANQLHSDLWPSAAKFEAEIVAMTANMLSAEATGAAVDSEQGVCGSVSSGGSESILLAMKTYRDWARAERGITEPEIVVPRSAHAAFHKAAQYFNLRLVPTPLDDVFRADVAAMREALTDNTIALVASAPNFPYGTIDPVEQISELARERGIGCHVDACLGGYFLPWAERLGYPVPAFDFRLPGVTSMSCDTHKYGYAAKGTSVILYRGRALRHHQFFTIADWPGGLYYSPTFFGSRPGGLSAACWAALVTIGEEGYLKSAKAILNAVAVMKQGIGEIPELKLLGGSLAVFAFASDELNIYEVLDQMSARKWALTGLQHPPAIHMSTTLRHTQPGVAERFVRDLKESVAYVCEHPGAEGGMAPIYGLAAAIPDKTIVHDMLRQVMDIYYRT